MKLEDHMKGINVAAQLNKQLSLEQTHNRQALMHVLSTLKFLCR